MDRGMEMGEDGEPSGAAPLREPKTAREWDMKWERGEIRFRPLFDAKKEKSAWPYPDGQFVRVREVLPAPEARSAPEPAPGEGSPSPIFPRCGKCEASAWDWIEGGRVCHYCRTPLHPSGPSQDSQEVDGWKASIANYNPAVVRFECGPNLTVVTMPTPGIASRVVSALLSQSPKGAAGVLKGVEAFVVGLAEKHANISDPYRQGIHSAAFEILCKITSLENAAVRGGDGPSAPKTELRGAPRLEEALGDVYRWHQNQVRLNLGAGLPVMLAEQVELALEATSSAPLSEAKGSDLPPSSQPAPGDVGEAGGAAV